MFQRSIPLQKNSLRSAKKWYFSYFAFWSTGQWEELQPPPGYATVYAIASTVAASSFRFHIPVCNSWDWLSTRFYEQHVTLLGLLGIATCWHVQQPKQTKKEPTITTSWPLLATVKSRTLMSWQYWWYIQGLREKFFQGSTKVDNGLPNLFGHQTCAKFFVLYFCTN